MNLFAKIYHVYQYVHSARTHERARTHLTNTLTHANAHYLALTKPFTPCATPQLASHARIRPIAAAAAADGGGGGDGCCYCCCDVDVVVVDGGGCCGCGLHPQPLGALSVPLAAIAVKGPTPTPPS